MSTRVNKKVTSINILVDEGTPILLPYEDGRVPRNTKINDDDNKLMVLGYKNNQNYFVVCLERERMSFWLISTGWRVMFLNVDRILIKFLWFMMWRQLSKWNRVFRGQRTKNLVKSPGVVFVDVKRQIFHFWG